DIFEWDIIIEKRSGAGYTWVGVCSAEYDRLNRSTASATVWRLCSDGYCFNINSAGDYCPPFGSGAKITVHLDMNKRSCAFTVNGTKYREVSEWNNLPSKLY